MNPAGGLRARDDRIREEVGLRYQAIARGGACCSGTEPGSACCGPPLIQIAPASRRTERRSPPRGSDLGLGCGDPTALLELRRGQVVLDLGSGAGGDCFRAADRVGRTGRVIGVDMTPEMIARARGNARTGRYGNVEFRLGEIEHLPVPDRSVDVVLSNCVLNLVPDKAAAYREAFRVLRPGGHLAVSDLVALRAVAPRDRADLALWSSCSSGAVTPRSLRRILGRAGFSPVAIEVRGRAASGPPGSEVAAAVVAADIRANRPKR